MRHTTNPDWCLAWIGSLHSQLQSIWVWLKMKRLAQVFVFGSMYQVAIRVRPYHAGANFWGRTEACPWSFTSLEFEPEMALVDGTNFLDWLEGGVSHKRKLVTKRWIFLWISL